MYYFYIVFSVVLFLIPIRSSSVGLYNNLSLVFLNSGSITDKSFNNLMLTLLTAIIIVLFIMMYFTIKLKRINKELQERNEANSQ